MPKDPRREGPNVDLLRARIIWLASKNRFFRGATLSRFSTSDLATMLDLPDPTSDPRGYDEQLRRAMNNLPTDSEPRLDELGRLCMDNPERRHSAPEGADVDAVVGYWMQATGRTRRSITERRKSIVRARLKDGWSVEQLKKAVDACLSSDWHTGENPRGIVYTDTSHIFTVERLEQWLTHRPKTDKRDDAISKAMTETVRRRRRRG